MILIAVAVMALAGVGEEECSDVAAITSYERNWYVVLGATNIYPKLHESEAKVDEKVNGLLGWLPDWQEPTTFADWRDSHFTWDLNLGVGCDVSPQTTLMLWAGGSRGIVRTKGQYGLLETDIHFTRTAIYLTPELSWYPWGKVDYAGVTEKKGGDWIRAALSGTRPYLAVATGYTWVRAEGAGKIKVPLLETIYQHGESENHHLLTFSPRLGVEVPVGRNSSFSLTAAYSFYNTHTNEYNGPSASFNYRWRF